MNRAGRRHLSAIPVDGSEPVKVSREVPVTIIAGAGGRREVIETDTAEPCYACKCCVLWIRSVETLRDSVREHVDGAHLDDRLAGCLVCQLLVGAADG